LAAEINAAQLVEDTPLDGDVLDSFQVPAHEVLGEFRNKVAQTVRREDAQTHYDLGIAYKEMGLLEEAVSEFEIVLHHGGGAWRRRALRRRRSRPTGAHRATGRLGSSRVRPLK